MIDPDPQKEKPPDVRTLADDGGSPVNEHDEELVEVPASVWANWLKALLGGESIGRATLVGDQIRAAASEIREGKPSPVVALGDQSSACPPLGLLHTRPSDGADCVTVLCGGAIASPHVKDAICRKFADRVQRRWQRQGIKLGFWSGEPPSDDASGQDTSRPADMPPRMGFRHLADLSYQSADADTIRRAHSDAALSSSNQSASALSPSNPPSNPSPSNPGNSSRIRLVRVAESDGVPPSDSVHRTNGESTSKLAELVEQTYVGSADCPAINQYRTAQQTLDGYRDSPTYSPEHWYWCVDADTNATLGCVLLAIHRSVDASDREHKNANDVAEIVYMALTPSHRGRGLGREVVIAVVDRVRANCGTVILAVDQSNAAAVGMYEKLGFQEVFRERLWFWHESQG